MQIYFIHFTQKAGFEMIVELKERLYSMSVEERKQLKGFQPERAEVIASGVNALYCIMKKFNIDSVTVSESDNLEGYLYSKIQG